MSIDSNDLFNSQLKKYELWTIFSCRIYSILLRSFVRLNLWSFLLSHSNRILLAIKWMRTNFSILLLRTAQCDDSGSRGGSSSTCATNFNQLSWSHLNYSLPTQCHVRVNKDGQSPPSSLNQPADHPFRSMIWPLIRRKRNNSSAFKQQT